jgi:hypothetical protein
VRVLIVVSLILNLFLRISQQLPFLTVEFFGIDCAGFGRFQLGILTYTGLAWLADAAEMILLSFIGPSVSVILV